MLKAWDVCCKKHHLLFLHAVGKAVVKAAQGRALTVQGVIHSLMTASCCRASLLQVLPCQCNGSLGVL